MATQRKDFEPPLAVERWGWKYHHIGIPTTEKRADERYIPHLKFYVSGFPTSPYGIEWMRFDADCPLPDIIQRVPHIAFEVEDLEEALKQGDFDVITPPNPPSEGVRVAMIEHNGAPVELIEFDVAGK